MRVADFCRENMLDYYEMVEALKQEKLEVESYEKQVQCGDLVITEIPEMERQLSKLEGDVDNNPEIRDILSTIQKAKTHRHAELVFNTLLGAISFKL